MVNGTIQEETNEQSRNLVSKFKQLELFEGFIESATEIFISFRSERKSILETKNKIEKFAERLINTLSLEDDNMFNIISSIEYGETLVSHSLKVAIISIFLASRYKMPPVKLKNLAIAALLHDIGKIKSNNPLLVPYFFDLKSDEELQKKHPEIGSGIVSDYLGLSQETSIIILRHHEQLDGSGFPAGIYDTSLSISDRIIFTANFMDNMFRKTYYAGLDNIALNLKKVFDNYPEKFDVSIVNYLFDIIYANKGSNRKFKRVTLALPAVFKLWQGTMSHKCRILDLSGGGARIRTKEILTVDDLVNLSFSLSGVMVFNDKQCHIVRDTQDERGNIYGLQFDDNTGTTQEKINTYLDRFLSKG
ncbi:MAG: PilZ domain-containing protein [Spirochaetes bacterium]|nr:PilZ domain-containing protein [Spirochaetota bacterium]